MCVFWVLRKLAPADARWRIVIYAIPPIAGGLGSWTGFEGQRLLFPALTALLWGGAMYLAAAMGPQAERGKKE
jgi:hypothetical protein